MQKMRIREWKRKNCLDEAFRLGLSLGTTPATYFFDQIFAPVKVPTASGMPDSYTYVNIGMNYSEISSIYATKYAGNFWPEYYEDTAELLDAVSNYRCEVVDRLVAVLIENTYKYKKLIETQGFAWNPLWNVDGTELHAIIEQHANEETTTGTDQTVTHKVAPYDDTTLKTQTEDKTTGTAANNKRTVKHIQDSHTVAAGDNAFGESLSGGDTYHAEKTVRQGNIGVTQTSQLLDSARRVLRWNILEEYFRDINRVLLIGNF